jgi:inhibitor of cysteine peptidase
MEKIKIFFGTILLLGLVLSLGGCSTEESEKEPDLIGWIDYVLQDQILVSSPGNNQSDKLIIKMTDRTTIFNQIDGRKDEVQFASLLSGQKVEIWFSGPVMESYPAQVSAKKILITEDLSGVVMPPLDDGIKSIFFEVTCDEFTADPHVTREVEVTFPGSLIVSLCANPTTGFEWEEVIIENGSIIYQTNRNHVSSESVGVVGASEKEVWSFNSGSSGTTTLIFEYSRPWEGGEKDTWTVGLTVLVK